MPRIFNSFWKPCYPVLKGTLIELGTQGRNAQGLEMMPSEVGSKESRS